MTGGRREEIHGCMPTAVSLEMLVPLSVAFEWPTASDLRARIGSTDGFFVVAGRNGGASDHDWKIEFVNGRNQDRGSSERYWK